MNKSRKKGIGANKKINEKLVDYKNLERNLLNEISNEFIEKNKNQKKQ